MSDIRDYFKSYRNKLGLSQSAFAKRYGVRKTDVYRWENKSIKNYTPLGVQQGDEFGRLTVLSMVRDFKGKRLWLCECACGNKFTTAQGPLVYRQTVSCGCFMREINSREGKTKIKKVLEKQLKDDFIDGTSLKSLNSKIPHTNTSGIKGVSFNKDTGTWKAYISLRGKQLYLGLYPTKEAAAQARRDAELKYFAPVLHEHGMNLKPQEIDQDMMKDDCYRREPFYDFKKGDYKTWNRTER